MATVSLVRTQAEEQLGLPDCLTLELDLGEVNFIDSSGVGCLVQLRNRSLTEGKTVRLGAIAAPVARILQICGVAKLFNTAPEPGHE